LLKAGAGLVSDDSAVGLTEVEAAVPARITEPRLQTTPIQKMRPGMRVLGRNPDRWDTQPVVEPDPVSWRLVSVRMEQQSGKFVLGQLLRPTSWIRHNNALPGAVIQLEIPEMHVAGDAEVLSISECPPIRQGQGSVVTGTFQHVSNEVISVFVEGEPEPIGTTSQHPFWSRDRNAFVPAGELRIGEELKTALGTSTRVTSIEIRAGPETVYGLEVASEHVYQITNAGLLVHNASGKSGTAQSIGDHTPVKFVNGNTYALEGSVGKRRWRLKNSQNSDLYPNLQRGVLPIDAPEGWAKHHLISVSEVQKSSTLKRLAEAGLWNVNRPSNGIALPTNVFESFSLKLPLHNGGHLAEYYADNALRLRALDARAPRLTDLQLLEEVGWIEHMIRTDLRNGDIRLQNGGY